MSQPPIHPPLVPFDRASARDVAAARALFDRVEAATGRPAMGADDQTQFEALVAGHGRAVAAIGHRGDRYVQISPALNEPDEWMLAVVDASGDRSGTALASMVAAGRDLSAVTRSQATRWWVSDPTELTDRIARGAGFQTLRGLYFMHVNLPLPDDGRPPLDVRAFRPGADDDGFLAANNAAFAGHPEQGNWSGETLAARMAEPWFDPAGFLLHEVDGRIAGFCWTKVHDELDPPEGEIFVIAAHPDFHGRGLGRGLTRAGLSYLASVRRTPVGQLYVDDANQAAVGLYRALGFTVTRRDRCYQWTAGA